MFWNFKILKNRQKAQKHYPPNKAPFMAKIQIIVHFYPEPIEFCADFKKIEI